MFWKLCVLFASCILFVNISANKTVPEGGLQVPQTTPCSLAFCAYNTTCKDVPATDCAQPPCGLTAKCVPISESETTTTAQQTCEDMKCRDDQYCSMNQVQCFAAPCPAMPMCITIPTPSITCANVRCAGGPCVMEKKHDPKTNTWSLNPACQPRPTS